MNQKSNELIFHLAYSRLLWFASRMDYKTVCELRTLIEYIWQSSSLEVHIPLYWPSCSVADYQHSGRAVIISS